MDLLLYLFVLNTKVFEIIDTVVFSNQISSSEEKVVYNKSQFDAISYGCARYYQLYNESNPVCDKFVADNNNGIIIIDDTVK